MSAPISSSFTIRPSKSQKAGKPFPKNALTDSYAPVFPQWSASPSERDLLPPLLFRPLPHMAGDVRLEIIVRQLIIYITTIL